jgi:hypothetical protein
VTVPGTKARNPDRSGLASLPDSESGLTAFAPINEFYA